MSHRDVRQIMLRCTGAKTNICNICPYAMRIHMETCFAHVCESKKIVSL